MTANEACSTGGDADPCAPAWWPPARIRQLEARVSELNATLIRERIERAQAVAGTRARESAIYNLGYQHGAAETLAAMEGGDA